MHAHCVLDARNELGEAPLWHPAEGALYWVDCISRELLRHVPGTEELMRWSLRDAPGSFAFCQDGRILLAHRRGLAFFDPATGLETPLTAKGVDFAVERFNDGKCDAHGRFWVGSMDRQLKRPIGSLYRFDRRLNLERVDSAFMTLSNGIAWSPDGRVMYVCDSRPGAVLSYDFEPQSGTVSNRRVFIDYIGRPGRPDGCTVDAEGGLWVAEFDGSRVSRHDPDGKCEREILLPVTRPTSVAFGGTQLTTLFITSMRNGLDLLSQPLAGGLFAIDPGVKGMSSPLFSI